MKRENLTREQLQSLDKEILITLLLNMQEQLAKQAEAIEKLTEQIAIMNSRTYGRKSEKITIDADQMNFFSEIFNEAEHLTDGQLTIEPGIDTVIIPEHKRRPEQTKPAIKSQLNFSSHQIFIIFFSKSSLEQIEAFLKFVLYVYTVPTGQFKNIAIFLLCLIPSLIAANIRNSLVNVSDGSPSNLASGFSKTLTLATKSG